jgi:hypothetical protein
MTLIEIRPHRWGWKVFEAPGVEPVFPEKRQAIDYAETRACAKSRRRDARGAIDLSRLLGSELRWHARIDSCC